MAKQNNSENKMYDTNRNTSTDVNTNEYIWSEGGRYVCCTGTISPRINFINITLCYDLSKSCIVYTSIFVVELCVASVEWHTAFVRTSTSVASLHVAVLSHKE